MERREFLASLTALCGGALASPCVAFLTRAEAAAVPAKASTPLFTPAQRELVAAATELILPTTDTPGARDAGVPDFVEMMLVDWFYDDERAKFLEGLTRFDVLAKEKTGKRFADAPEADQIAVLQQLEKEGNAEIAGAGGNPLAIFMEKKPVPAIFQSLKQLTLVGYYTSEIGGTKELKYEPIPGPFESCIETGKHDREWRRL